MIRTYEPERPPAVHEPANDLSRLLSDVQSWRMAHGHHDRRGRCRLAEAELTDLLADLTGSDRR